MATARTIKRQDLLYPEISYKIIGSAFDVHNELGSGHPEKIYEKALAELFSKKGLHFKKQVYYSIIFNDKIIGKKFLDFLVEDKVIVEIKKGDRFSKSHIDQILEYLKMNHLQLAILINFGNQGVVQKRIININ